MLPTVALVIALAVVPYAVFRGYAAHVAESTAPVENKVHRLERAQQIGGMFLSIVSILALVRIGGFDWLADGLAVGPELFGHNLVTLLLILVVPFGFVVLPILSMTLGGYPTVQSLRGTEASTVQVAKRTCAGLALVTVSVAVSIGGFFGIISVFGESTLMLLAALGVVVVGSFGLFPYLTLVFQDRVPLAGDRRERIEQLCADLGYRPRGLYLLEGQSVKTANALVAGTIPGFRYVFLTDYLVSESSDTELKAILAHEYGHIAGRHLWQRGILTVAVFGFWIIGVDRVGLDSLEAQFGFAGFFLPFMMFYFVYHVAFLGSLALWQEYRADAYAAEQTGTDATVNALELLAEANDSRQDVGLVYALLTHHPSIADRIETVQD